MRGPSPSPTEAAGAAAGLRTEDFDYPLDETLIAQRPLPERDSSRLLTVRRTSGRFEDRVFRDLPELMSAGDVLVINDSRVFPARLLGRKPTGAAVEVLLIEPLDAAERRWRALVRPGGKLKPGRVVEVSADLALEIEAGTDAGERVVHLVTSLAPRAALERWGHVPLPPYIRRRDDEADRERYQTIYARDEGSVAAPTAGLHISQPLLELIRGHGVEVAQVTLHVGPGTFRPVEVADPADHQLGAERYRVTEEAAAIINSARGCGGAVWAVGTTTVRTLESAARTNGTVEPGAAATELFIRPGHKFRVVD
ncbi:MAG: tRNA preQ1(34) S-adenosylmethionine ribosyltransferase-isomerase QueA, partial [Acidobacteria bacterium]|nr:tRNA preQ1(34) S-adenosylmethionine ribosyltransferase-isomerase QueA [Acidobacteriota bacterium]NIQ31613.1 tRNA preQ1(34) S-adenosylmethionine ribosyltransferase-isomerase QueA [Acidobacteriota bacterium]